MYDICMRKVNAIQFKETVISTLFFVKTEIVVKIKTIEQNHRTKVIIILYHIWKLIHLDF